ncbi:MaoC family dehydratase [Myxococcota bacterium]|nr:MaoC family dehydratase [Myxococcota bacterium]MCZ7618083.1 MaoC family dehydratase [Myxococcota bacterium]
MPTVFASPAELAAAVGRHLGWSDWLQIDQARIDQFAAATGDHQWIHVDPERARNGPFGRCIAHGYLTQSLVNHFLPQIVRVDGIAMGVNYGADRLRFPAPVPVGSRVRGGAELLEATPQKDGSVQVKYRVTVEIEDHDKPGCVIDTIARYYPD